MHPSTPKESQPHHDSDVLPSIGSINNTTPSLHISSSASSSLQSYHTVSPTTHNNQDISRQLAFLFSPSSNAAPPPMQPADLISLKTISTSLDTPFFDTWHHFWTIYRQQLHTYHADFQTSFSSIPHDNCTPPAIQAVADAYLSFEEHLDTISSQLDLTLSQIATFCQEFYYAGGLSMSPDQSPNKSPSNKSPSPSDHPSAASPSQHPPRQTYFPSSMQRHMPQTSSDSSHHGSPAAAAAVADIASPFPQIAKLSSSQLDVELLHCLPVLSSLITVFHSHAHALVTIIEQLYTRVLFVAAPTSENRELLPLLPSCILLAFPSLLSLLSLHIVAYVYYVAPPMLTRLLLNTHLEATSSSSSSSTTIKSKSTKSPAIPSHLVTAWTTTIQNLEPKTTVQNISQNLSTFQTAIEDYQSTLANQYQSSFHSIIDPSSSLSSPTAATAVTSSSPSSLFLDAQSLHAICQDTLSKSFISSTNKSTTVHAVSSPLQFSSLPSLLASCRTVWTIQLCGLATLRCLNHITTFSSGLRLLQDPAAATPSKELQTIHQDNSFASILASNGCHYVSLPVEQDALFQFDTMFAALNSTRSIGLPSSSASSFYQSATLPFLPCDILSTDWLVMSLFQVFHLKLRFMMQSTENISSRIILQYIGEHLVDITPLLHFITLSYQPAYFSFFIETKMVATAMTSASPFASTSAQHIDNAVSMQYNQYLTHQQAMLFQQSLLHLDSQAITTNTSHLLASSTVISCPVIPWLLSVLETTAVPRFDPVMFFSFPTLFDHSQLSRHISLLTQAIPFQSVQSQYPSTTHVTGDFYVPVAIYFELLLHLAQHEFQSMILQGARDIYSKPQQNQNNHQDEQDEQDNISTFSDLLMSDDFIPQNDDSNTAAQENTSLSQFPTTPSTPSSPSRLVEDISTVPWSSLAQLFPNAPSRRILQSFLLHYCPALLSPTASVDDPSFEDILCIYPFLLARWTALQSVVVPSQSLAIAQLQSSQSTSFQQSLPSFSQNNYQPSQVMASDHSAWVSLSQNNNQPTFTNQFTLQTGTKPPPEFASFSQNINQPFTVNTAISSDPWKPANTDRCSPGSSPSKANTAISSTPLLPLHMMPRASIAQYERYLLASQPIRFASLFQTEDFGTLNVKALVDFSTSQQQYASAWDKTASPPSSSSFFPPCISPQNANTLRRLQYTAQNNPIASRLLQASLEFGVYQHQLADLCPDSFSFARLFGPELLFSDTSNTHRQFSLASTLLSSVDSPSHHHSSSSSTPASQAFDFYATIQHQLSEIQAEWTNFFSFLSNSAFFGNALTFVRPDTFHTQDPQTNVLANIYESCCTVLNSKIVMLQTSCENSPPASSPSSHQDLQRLLLLRVFLASCSLTLPSYYLSSKSSNRLKKASSLTGYSSAIQLSDATGGVGMNTSHTAAGTSPGHHFFNIQQSTSSVFPQGAKIRNFGHFFTFLKSMASNQSLLSTTVEKSSAAFTTELYFRALVAPSLSGSALSFPNSTSIIATSPYSSAPTIMSYPHELSSLLTTTSLHDRLASLHSTFSTITKAPTFPIQMVAGNSFSILFCQTILVSVLRQLSQIAPILRQVVDQQTLPLSSSGISSLISSQLNEQENNAKFIQWSFLSWNSFEQLESAQLAWIHACTEPQQVTVQIRQDAIKWALFKRDFSFVQTTHPIEFCSLFLPQTIPDPSTSSISKNIQSSHHISSINDQFSQFASYLGASNRFTSLSSIGKDCHMKTYTTINQVIDGALGYLLGFVFRIDPLSFSIAPQSDPSHRSHGRTKNSTVSSDMYNAIRSTPLYTLQQRLFFWFHVIEPFFAAWHTVLNKQGESLYREIESICAEIVSTISQSQPSFVQNLLGAVSSSISSSSSTTTSMGHARRHYAPPTWSFWLGLLFRAKSSSSSASSSASSSSENDDSASLDTLQTLYHQLLVVQCSIYHYYRSLYFCLNDPQVVSLRQFAEFVLRQSRHYQQYTTIVDGLHLSIDPNQIANSKSSLITALPSVQPSSKQSKTSPLSSPAPVLSQKSSVFSSPSRISRFMGISQSPGDDDAQLSQILYSQIFSQNQSPLFPSLQNHMFHAYILDKPLSPISYLTVATSTPHHLPALDISYPTSSSSASSSVSIQTFQDVLNDEIDWQSRVLLKEVLTMILKLIRIALTSPTAQNAFTRRSSPDLQQQQPVHEFCSPHSLDLFALYSVYHALTTSIPSSDPKLAEFIHQQLPAPESITLKQLQNAFMHHDTTMQMVKTVFTDYYYAHQGNDDYGDNDGYDDNGGDDDDDDQNVEFDMDVQDDQSLSVESPSVSIQRLETLINTTSVDPFENSYDPQLSQIPDLQPDEMISAMEQPVLSMRGITLDFEAISSFMPCGIIYNILESFIPNRVVNELLKELKLDKTHQVPNVSTLTLFNNAQDKFQTLRGIDTKFYLTLAHACAVLAYQDDHVQSACLALQNGRHVDDSQQELVQNDDNFLPIFSFATLLQKFLHYLFSPGVHRKHDSPLCLMTSTPFEITCLHVIRNLLRIPHIFAGNFSSHSPIRRLRVRQPLYQDSLGTILTTQYSNLNCLLFRSLEPTLTPWKPTSDSANHEIPLLAKLRDVLASTLSYTTLQLFSSSIKPLCQTFISTNKQLVDFERDSVQDHSIVEPQFQQQFLSILSPEQLITKLQGPILMLIPALQRLTACAPLFHLPSNQLLASKSAVSSSSPALLTNKLSPFQLELFANISAHLAANAQTNTASSSENSFELAKYCDDLFFSSVIMSYRLSRYGLNGLLYVLFQLTQVFQAYDIASDYQNASLPIHPLTANLSLFVQTWLLQQAQQSPNHTINDSIDSDTSQTSPTPKKLFDTLVRYTQVDFPSSQPDLELFEFVTPYTSFTTRNDTAASLHPNVESNKDPAQLSGLSNNITMITFPAIQPSSNALNITESQSHHPLMFPFSPAIRFFPRSVSALILSLLSSDERNLIDSLCEQEHDTALANGIDDSLLKQDAPCPVGELNGLFQQQLTAPKLLWMLSYRYGLSNISLTEIRSIIAFYNPDAESQ